MRWSKRPLPISAIDSPTSRIGLANQLATKYIAIATASTVTTASTTISEIDSRATAVSGASGMPSATRPTCLPWNSTGVSKPSTPWSCAS